ncbi:MAG: maltose alpha-D-glucosyltransferase [Anaerolineaceae bacterium]|nr:maltose alpha-D-glucosyltransferase [Anaerolineaceae bacterium]
MIKKDLFWYKKAIFYELNVRAFKDSNSDGWGDLPGLISKLDYLRQLGIDAIWLLPIMPSPLNDDGYDVSDFMEIFPAYGRLQDFKTLMREAHRRGLRVLVEIIPNHTSNQHPWFLASRNPEHPEFETYKDYYVWSADKEKYKEARIIFTDTESSNWTWDEKRGLYFWHRFFSSQPDLNYDKPAVQQAMLDVIRFWLDKGVDGLRIDAPPYLFEREGTSCENLPETHDYLQKVRRFVDDYKPGTLLISEANMWPEDVVQYFSKGDEMHMNFHFPLMPRLFMALAKEDVSPIQQILERTPALPTDCQWGTFLRCHDELTLEMVTEEERLWMWGYYAAEPGQRLNMGIRRRLAPLMNNDPRRILLMHSLLLTMGGSPFLYYGDEIGMGDNIALRDRNGLRTPMQWDSGKNGGFSDAPAAALYAPPIADPVYGYPKVNVAAQEQDPHSLLNQLRHLIAVRKKNPLFGLGSFAWKRFANDKKIAAYERCHAGKRLIILNNLSAKPSKGWLAEDAPRFTDIVTGKRYQNGDLRLESYQFLWLKPDKPRQDRLREGPNTKRPAEPGSDRY